MLFCLCPLLLEGCNYSQDMKENTPEAKNTVNIEKFKKALFEDDSVLIERMINTGKFSYATVIDSEKCITAINWSILNEKRSIFDLFVRKGINFKFDTSVCHSYPIITIASLNANSTYYLNECLKLGANVNDFDIVLANTIDDYEAELPLYAAIFSNNIESVKILVKHGADINHVRDSIPTPLAYALQYEFFDIAYFLLQSGANHLRLNYFTVDKQEQKIDFFLKIPSTSTTIKYKKLISQYIAKKPN